jgi:ATP-dependent RNA helicase HelY
MPRHVEIPTQALRRRYRTMTEVYDTIRRSEDAHQVELCRELDPGFTATIFSWAEGKPLEDVLVESGMPAGDFVRNCKQLLDLLRQIEDIAGPGLAQVARQAYRDVNRSVVAYTGLEAA